MPTGSPPGIATRSVRAGSLPPSSRPYPLRAAACYPPSAGRCSPFFVPWRRASSSLSADDPSSAGRAADCCDRPPSCRAHSCRGECCFAHLKGACAMVGAKGRQSLLRNFGTSSAGRGISGRHSGASSAPRQPRQRLHVLCADRTRGVFGRWSPRPPPDLLERMFSGSQRKHSEPGDVRGPQRSMARAVDSAERTAPSMPEP
jgi:hypothetical protein